VTGAPRARRWWLAPLLDLACIVAFILVGGGNHHIAEGATWFVTVLWPIAVGWYAVALVARLYVCPGRWALRLAVTIAAGTVVMCVLRGGFTDRPWVSVFTVIYASWMTLTTFGWRLAARLVTRRRSAPTTPASASGPR
jgi:hypothetical protein